MKEVIISELRKISTTKLWWIALLCVFVLGGAYAILPAALAVLQQPVQGETVPPGFDTWGTVMSVYNGGNTLSRVFALLVGVMAMGGEYRHKTLTSTYLATPQRRRVIAAKAISLGAYGLLYGLASVLAGVLVAVAFVIAQDGSFFLSDPATWRSLGLGVLSIALWAMIGPGIGLLIKNMMVALLVRLHCRAHPDRRAVLEELDHRAQPVAQWRDELHAFGEQSRLVGRPRSPRLVAGIAGPGRMVPAAGPRRSAVHRTARRALSHSHSRGERPCTRRKSSCP